MFFILTATCRLIALQSVRPCTEYLTYCQSNFSVDQSFTLNDFDLNYFSSSSIIQSILFYLSAAEACLCLNLASSHNYHRLLPRNFIPMINTSSRSSYHHILLLACICLLLFCFLNVTSISFSSAFCFVLTFLFLLTFPPASFSHLGVRCFLSCFLSVYFKMSHKVSACNNVHPMLNIGFKYI